MNKDEFNSIAIGDIVRRVINGEAYLVVASHVCHGHGVDEDRRSFTIQRIITMTNPEEWQIVHRGSL